MPPEIRPEYECSCVFMQQNFLKKTIDILIGCEYTLNRGDNMKRIHGRKGEAAEFVEFQSDKHRISIVIQRSGDRWNIYKVWPGTVGRVITLHAGLRHLATAEVIGQAAAVSLFEERSN